MAETTVVSIDNLSQLVAVSSGDKLVVQHNGQAYQADASLFKGADGQRGADGVSGTDGIDGVSPTVGVSKTGTVTTLTIVDVNGTRTATINDGAGIPAGGTANQVLKKASNTDFDYAWGNQTAVNGIPAGGSAGQALIKNSSADFDAGWGNIAGGAVPAGGDAAQVLVKRSSTDFDTIWASFMTPPYPSASDAGKVLTVNANGQYVLMDAVLWFNTYIAPTLFNYNSGTNTLNIVTSAE